MKIFSISILFLAAATFAIKRIFTYLHAFQQHEYNCKEFIAWIYSKYAFDKKLTSLFGFLTICGFIISNFVNIAQVFIPISVFIFCFFAYLEKDPRIDAKKCLTITNRAKRILIITMTLFSSIFATAAILGYKTYFFSSTVLFINIALVQIIPVCILIANSLLTPIERKIQQHFWREAKEKLETVNPFIIGITGSFGKTSVKHILGHILNTTNANVLYTPGSVNTVMGVARIIREQLTSKHRFFIVEMGAYGVNSINKLCDLTPPNLGIITAIGKSHYSRFKSLDTIAKAKFELAEHVIKRGGTIVTCEQVLVQKYANQFMRKHNNLFVVCKNNAAHLKDADVYIKEASQTKEGLTITVENKGNSYTLNAGLHGMHNATNIAMSFAAACKLGVEPYMVATALKSIPKIKHRLEVINKGNYTVIDDAYNSNPEGFISALKLMNVLAAKDGRKILVTPGIVELGKDHYNEHRILGRHAAQYTDVALVVNAKRIPSFVSAFNQTASHTQIIVQMNNFAEAKQWIQNNSKPNDVILLANDLPDVYENVPSI